MECQVSIFTIRINLKSFLWAVCCAPEVYPPNVFVFSRFQLHTYGIDNAAILSHMIPCLQ